jgi:HlyD family secretion protein
MNLDQVTNFSVKVRILPESYAKLCEGMPEGYSPFRPGMSATVKIRTESKSNVLSVPIRAIATREDTSSLSRADQLLKKKESEELEKVTGEQVSGDEPFTVLFVANESTGKAEIRVVETGIQDNKFIEVKSGINEGEKIITDPYDIVSRSLKPGDKIKLVDKEKEKEEEKD